MAAYRFMATNLLSGAVTADNLPVTAQQFGRVLSGAAQGSLSLDLRADVPPSVSAAYISAVLPRKSVLWGFMDNALVWNGVVWDWNHQSIASGMLPLGCQSLESLLAHRIGSKSFTFAGTDVFDMFRTLVRYAFSKSPNGQVAGITYSGGQSGITDTVTFDGTQYQFISDAAATLVQGYGIEYSFRPYQDTSGNLRTNVDLALTLGLPQGQSRLAYNFPGNVLDYAFQATGSTSANSVYATSENLTASGAPFAANAQDAADLAAGYPLSELAVSVQGTIYSSSAQLLAYAQGFLPKVTDTQLTPVLILGAGSYPTVAQTILGSWAQFNATSPLHPANPDGSPGFQGTGRVVGWTAFPPGEGQQSEYVKVQLGDMRLSA